VSVLLGGDSALRLALVTLFMALVPGLAIASHLRIDRAGAWGAAVASFSLVVWLGVPLVELATGQWGSLGSYWITAAVSALVAIAAVVRARSEPTVAWRDFSSGPTRLPADARPVMYTLAASIAVWIVGVVLSRSATPSQYGLAPQLSPLWYLGLAGTIVAFALALRRPTRHPLELALPVAAMVLMLHGTTSILYDQARFTWPFKHFGVADYIGLHGGVNRHVDIYHSWPGFFAGIEWLAQVSGTRFPFALARWWPLVIESVAVLLLRRLFLAITGSSERAWLGCVI
jgi:hypothetical protein